ncbi:MAG TPA: DNA polymerase III subunit delta [Bdellovibrionales bacterium]|nr:DNA polymerase III subunit delta [Bdellovibrionales bacterium]
MAAIDPKRLSDLVKRGPLSPLYLFFGEEPFLIEESLEELVNAALDGGIKDFNYNVFYASDDDVSKVRDAIETLPMMCARRVVVLKGAHQLKTKELEELMPIIDSPVDSTVFIMVADSIDQRLRFFKQFAQSGILVQFQRPYDNQIPMWIETLAKRHGMKLNAESVELVHQMVGSNLIDIDNELRKLSQFVGARKDVTVEDVKQIVSTLRVDTVFQLANAIGNNDRSTALDHLANLLGHGESPIGILALVSRHIRILMTVKDGLREGLTAGQLGSRVGVPPFFMKQYVEQSRQWSDDKLNDAHTALLLTDRALKSSPVTPHIWLENFILKTCS